MSELEQPASLNAFQQYRQACAILSDTSRATLPAWYQEALELDFQAHIVVDGVSVLSFFYDRSKDEWTEGPPISDEVFSNAEQTEAFADQLQKKVRQLKGKSVGVVVHAADEFATAELKPELDNPAALADLRETAYDTPGEILDDSSIPPDQATWRVLPYPAAGSEVIGTTITLSRRLESFVATLRSYGNNRNFPFITHVLSAPMVALMGLPSILTPTPGKQFVTVLQFAWFTVMAFFNEHSDLRLIRTLQHRGARRPSNLRDALATTNASLEFDNPDIVVMPMAEDIDPSVVENLKSGFADSRVENLSYPAQEPFPAWVPGPAVALSEIPAEQSEALSHTFGVLRTERWFLQDFIPPSKEAVALFPSRNEMRLLRFVKLGRIALVGIALLGIAWLAFNVLTVVRRPEWAFNENEAKAVKQRLVNITRERQRLDHWNNLLQDRSKAWASMEALARLFPADSGLLVKTFNHVARPDSAPGQVKVGFVKEWVVTGLARDEALAYLNSLNTREGISARFTEIAEATGNDAYDPAPQTRTIVVNVKTQENSGFKQRPAEDIYDWDETTYPFTFNLTITQRFESADPLSVAASKAP